MGFSSLVAPKGRLPNPEHAWVHHQRPFHPSVCGRKSLSYSAFLFLCAALSDCDYSSVGHLNPLRIR